MIYACPPLADAHAAAHSASAAAIHICTVVHRLTSQRKPTYAARTHERGTTYYLNARLRSSSSCSLQLCSNSFDASRSARKSSRLTTIEHSSPSLRACGSSDMYAAPSPCVLHDSTAGEGVASRTGCPRSTYRAAGHARVNLRHPPSGLCPCSFYPAKFGRSKLLSRLVCICRMSAGRR